jgi:hypothetical protein
MKTIKDIWEHYEPVLVPSDAPPIVRQETRRAFYTGAHAALSRVMALGDDRLNNDAAAAGLAALCKELGLYFVDVAINRLIQQTEGMKDERSKSN